MKQGSTLTLDARKCFEKQSVVCESDRSTGLSVRRHWFRTLSPAVLAASLLVAGGAQQAHAQGSGEITGTVTDPTGAVIPKASVTLVDPATGAKRTDLTNGSGIFDFTGIDVGKYDLTIQVNGFETLKKSGIVMNVAQSLREDATLAAGSESQTVNVTADALQVQSENNEISTLITGQQVVQLATNGRNVYGLTTLGTGVATTNPSFNGVTAQGSSASISFNGMRPDHNNWLIDGGEVYDRGSGGKLDVMPSPDMLDQFQVLSSNYTPDYGISSGGTVLMELKSGTKDFHGGLWEFNRNDLFDANNYFSKQATPAQAKPELRLNIWGGAVGGPVVIPHLYNTTKTKTFFFAGEEWRRLVIGAQPTIQNTIPAADFPTAGQNFTYVPFGSDLTKVTTCPNGATGNGIICVPVTTDPAKLAQYAAAGVVAGAPFPNNTIPASLLDANAVLFMGTGAIPHPNSGVSNYVASPKQPTSVREDVVRVDQVLSDKYHLLGSWIHDQMSQTEIPTQWSGDSYSTVGDVFSNPSWAAVIKLSQTLSPTLLNETALNVNGNTIQINPLGVTAQPAGWSATGFFAGNNADNRLPQIAFSNGPINTTYTSIYFPWHNSYLDYQIRDDLSKTWGKHATKFGFGYMRADKNQQLQADTQGDYTFSGSGFSQNPYTNLLLGFASSYQQLQNQRTDHYINNTYSVYAQDDWHATARLTLNLGFRYDALPHVYEKNNQLGDFDPSAYSAANAQTPNANGQLDPTGPGFQTVNGAPFYLNGIRLAGVNGVPPSLVNNNYFTLQPRIGFAYDLFGDGKSILRGGYGVFYERVQGNDTYDIDTTPPFAYQPVSNNVYFSNPNTSNQTGATAALPFFPAGLREESVYYPNPGTEQFSLGLQQAIAPSVVFGFGYVGTTGWNQDDIREVNDLNFGTNPATREAVANGTTNVNLYRPYQGYSNIGQEENAQNFTYNSLQAQLRMEQKHGVTAQFSYTWSHEIDIQSADLGSTSLAGSGGFLSNPYDPKYDRGSGGFDRRNIFSANYIYALPFFLHSSDGLLRNAAGGWEISGITTFESGVPINVYYNSADVLGLGGNTTNRPNINGHVSYPKQQAQWFNTSVFSAPIAPWQSGGLTTGFGNARKDAVVGPGLNNWNLSIFKSFHVTSHEGPTIQLRAETYNTFNHTQFQNVDTGTNDGTYGQVTSTYDPRVMQFAAKFLF